MFDIKEKKSKGIEENFEIYLKFYLKLEIFSSPCFIVKEILKYEN